MSKTVIDKPHFDQLFNLDRLDLIIQYLRVVFQQHADDQLLQELRQLDGRLVANQKQVSVENTERNQIRARLLDMVKEAIALGYLEPKKNGWSKRIWLFVFAVFLVLCVCVLWIKMRPVPTPERVPALSPIVSVRPDTTSLEQSRIEPPTASQVFKEERKSSLPPEGTAPKSDQLIPVLLIINSVCKDVDVLVDGIVVPAEQVSSTRKRVYVQGGMLHTFKVGSATQSKMVDMVQTSDAVEVVLNCH